MKVLFFTVLMITNVCFAAFKPNECTTTDWQQKGEFEGRTGVDISQLYKYTKICDKIGQQFSVDDYRRGRETGLYSFCSNENAFNLGFQKKRVSKDICTQEMFPDFQTYYKNGKEFLTLSKKQKSLDKKLVSLKKVLPKIDRLETEIEGLQAKIESVNFKPEMMKTRINKSNLMLQAESKELEMESRIKPLDKSDGDMSSKKNKTDDSSENEVESETDEESLSL